MDKWKLEMNIRQSEMEAAGRRARMRGLDYPIRDCYMLELAAENSLRRNYAARKQINENSTSEQRVVYLNRILAELRPYIDMDAYRALMPQQQEDEGSRKLLDSLILVSKDLGECLGHAREVDRILDEFNRSSEEF